MNKSSKKLQTVFIRNDDSYSTIVQDIAQEFRKDCIVPLFGAGISFDSPSNLLLAKDLICPLINALRTCVKYAIDEIDLKSKDWDPIEKILKNVRMERLLDAFHKTHGRPALEYLSVLNGTTWNYNHASIAALAEYKYLTRCITLNFDLLIEEAIAARNLSCITECPLTNQKFDYGEGHQCLHILKPHGSFTPSQISVDPLKYLSATLSQVGSRPTISNMASFQRILINYPTLFVAGYSDDDWDIFPIIDRLKHMIKNIIWVQYATEDQVKHHIVPQMASSEYDALHKRIIPWLDMHKGNSTLLIGRLKYFFEDLLGEIGIKTLNLTAETVTRKMPDTTPFFPINNKIGLRVIKTNLSLAILIQQTGTFSVSLLKWLQKILQSYDHPELSWQVEDLIGHTKHTWGDINGAIRHTQKVITIKTSFSKGKSSVADEFIWLGYEYLCMAKRPNIRRPATILLMPIHVVKGLWYLRKGVKSAQPFDKKKLGSFASYYKADLLHSWGNLLMLFGPCSNRLCRPIFAFILKLYGRISQDSELMDGEYYWLRLLEAKIIAGAQVNREEVDRVLDEIERSYQLVQNNVQQGNTLAYKALLCYALNPKDKSTPIKYLNEAEMVWLQVGSGISSGFRRITLFRRFMGHITFVEAIKHFLKNSESI